MRLSGPVWEWADAAAERAGLALGAWVALLAGDVVSGLPEVGEEQLSAVRDARAAVARIGSAVNSLAAAEHLGRPAEPGQLAAVLGRVDDRVAQAVAAVSAVAGAMSQPQPRSEVVPVGDVEGRGRRRPEVGAGRDRWLLVRVSPAERGRLAAAAESEGLAVGAWLGKLLEDRDAARPLRGQVWGAVFAARKALRAVATNLLQIEQVRVAAGVPGVAELAGARVRVEAAIRACLDAEAAIGAAGRQVAA